MKSMMMNVDLVVEKHGGVAGTQLFVKYVPFIVSLHVHFYIHVQFFYMVIH